MTTIWPLYDDRQPIPSVTVITNDSCSRDVDVIAIEMEFWIEQATPPRLNGEYSNFFLSIRFQLFLLTFVQGLDVMTLVNKVKYSHDSGLTRAHMPLNIWIVPITIHILLSFHLSFPFTFWNGWAFNIQHHIRTIYGTSNKIHMIATIWGKVL